MQSRLLVLLAALLAGCSTPPATEKKEPAKKAEKPKPPESYRVKLETTKGDIVIEVTRAWSPYGADHFYELVAAGFYDNVKFHRVLKKFIAQFGINGDPNTDRLYANLKIPDDPPKEKNRRGTVAFAKLGPNSRTTEVFINLANNAMLDTTGFTPFGKIVEGMEVADQLAYVYGELQPKGGGPDPTKIHLIGNKYLDSQYPRLDAIKKATILTP
jgi:peptidyl-prolyl cis-trans isomerase A (cyclophilin A)